MTVRVKKYDRSCCCSSPLSITFPFNLSSPDNLSKIQYCSVFPSRRKTPEPKMEETHIIEISTCQTQEQKQLICLDEHPLKEISASPGHLLLLKLWQREEDIISQRIGIVETHLDGIKRETFRLCSLFFLFHFIFLTLLFGSSDHSRCKDWWVPCTLSLGTSIAIVFGVQSRLFGYWKVWGELQRERGNGRALTRCVQELRMKGASFDLSKEPVPAKKMKSSSVEIKWKPLRWCGRNAVGICLVCFSGLSFTVSKFMVCLS